MKKFTARLLLFAVLLLWLPQGAVGATSRQYLNNFWDVPADAWYHDSVVQAYEMGLINGKNQIMYDPAGSLTLAECIKLAACIHQLREAGAVTLQNGTPHWYDSYVQYALEAGILAEAPDDLSAAVTRARAAEIFAGALEADAEEINTRDCHYTDVWDETVPYADAVYRLYRCGIMTGDDRGRFCPDDPINRGEAAAVAVRMAVPAARVQRSIALSEEVSVPVLMYHHFDTEAGDYTTTPETLRSHFEMFRREGYTTITFAELLRYVDGEDNLPEKPILLLSDDGYYSVLEYALPLLEEYGMKMSVAVVGETVGRRGGWELAKFTLEEVEEMDTAHRLELVSHSYGLHKQTEELHGAVNLNLGAAAYAARLRADCRAMAALGGEAHPMMKTVFVYPYGKYTAESERFLKENGYRVTVTTDRGIDVLSPGDKPVLLQRITAEWYATGEALLKEIFLQTK